MKELLRAVKPSDLEMIRRWRNAPEVRENMYTTHLIDPDEHARWWERMSADDRVRLLLLEKSGVALGFVSFTNYTGPNGSATWAFYSGDTTQRGVGSMMERAALEYAFEELRVFRLECEVLEFNRPVIDFHLKNGFDIEGIFRKAYERDGNRYSIYRLAMLRDKWERSVQQMLQSDTGVRGTLAGLRLEWSDVVAPDLIAQYASATGDDNPLHLEDSAAQKYGFDRRISHGMLIGGLLSRFFANQFPGQGTVYLSQDLKFKAPVYAGDLLDHTLTVRWHVGNRIGVHTLSSVGSRECVHGEALLLLPAGDWAKERFQQ